LFNNKRYGNQPAPERGLCSKTKGKQQMTTKNETWKKLAMCRGDYCESLQAENGRLRSTLESARDALIGIQNGRYDARQCGFIARLLESAIRE